MIWKKCKQILIFWVFKIALLSHWLQIKFSMLLFFYLFTFAINWWHRKFATATLMQCLSTINMVFSDEDFLIKSLYLKRCRKKLTDEFPEKSWTKLGGNKLWKMSRDTGTVDRATVYVVNSTRRPYLDVIDTCILIDSTPDTDFTRDLHPRQ